MKAHWKEHGPPPPKSVKISASQNEKQAENDARSDDDSRDSYQEVDDNPFGSGGCIGLQEELDADGAQYLHMVETKWTPIGVNCVVFPNFKIRNEAVELKDTDFIHVYQLRYNTDSSQSETGRCKKFAPRKNKAMPGLLVVYCAEHSCVIGYEMMEYAESARTVFRYLATRHSDCMPDVFFYDNSCNLHDFAMVREPTLFQKVHFLIDTLHWSSRNQNLNISFQGPARLHQPDKKR